MQSVFALVIVAVFRLPGCADKPPFIPVKQMIATKILQASLIFDKYIRTKSSLQSSSENKLYIPEVRTLSSGSLYTLAV